jgi:thiol-disulfide isomerase/thioredoxin
MKRVWKNIAIVFATLLIVAGCGGLLFFKLAQRHVAGNLRPPHLAVESTDATDFPFRTLDGQIRRLSDFKGKVVFLDLWGTWCIQCVAEMPRVQELYSHYRGDPNVQFLIVSRMDRPETVAR